MEFGINQLFLNFEICSIFALKYFYNYEGNY